MPEIERYSEEVTQVNRDEIDFLDLLQEVAEKLRILISVPVVVGVAAFALSYLIPPTFTATAKFLPPQQQQSAAASMLQSLGALGGVAGAAAGLKNPGDQFVALLQSRVVADALVDKFDLMTRYETKLRETTREKLKKNTVISIGKDNIIAVSADDTDPVFAAKLSNAYIDQLSILLNRLAITEAQQRRLFFGKELAAARDSLAKAEQNLGSSGVNLSALNATPASALEGPARLRAQVTAQEVRIATLRSYLTTSAPEFKQAQAELNALRQQLANAAEEQPTTRTNQDYITKFREFKYQETLFDLFARQYEIARVDESKEGAVIQVVDPALPPERKSKPSKVLIALGLSVATFMTLLLFFVIRFLAFNSSPSKRAKWRRLSNSVNMAFSLKRAGN